jgi:EAL domain-containing protein (putative c-di-GMP-specific phosphodiesterase class I)
VKAGKSRRVIERLARDDVRARATTGQRRDLGLDERDLAAALANRELLLQYQPIVDIRSGSCRRVEALVRWKHPRHGQILPGEFLHLASPSLLQAIDLWVINAALHQRLGWRAEGEQLGVCVNLTRHDIAQVEQIIGAVQGVERHAITLELRAADLKSLGVDAQLAPAKLAATGARVALDDVRPDDAPTRAVAATIDEIKIARSLVTRAAGDARARSDVRSLVEFARAHRLSVVAVGVEDRATFDLVASLGCDMAQGYWVSRPLVPDRLRPARRWAAGLAFTGVLAFGSQVAASKVAASGGRAIELPLSQSGLFSSACCLDVAVASDASRLPAAAKLEQVQARTGLPFTSSATARADLFVESSLGSDFTRTLTSKVDGDIASLEQEFGRTLESRPSIYIFATRSNFALGLQRAFGVRGPDAGVLAATNGGIALTRQNAIVINLQNVNAKDLAVVRHELTHTIVHQIIGADGDIPTWLHEGIATTQERRGMDDDLASARNASTALSVLSAGSATLEDLEPAEQWIQRNAALGGQAYTVSAEAVRLLEERVSHEGLLRILDGVGRGESFGAAFAAVAGESLGDFERSFPARLAADQASARVVQAPHADGVRWSIAGFTPNKPVTISIDGAQYKLKFEVVADRNGMYEAVFGATAPKGEYTLRATSAAADASVTLRT